VCLELRPEHLLRAAWLAYGLPLFCMVAGTGVAAGLAAPGDDSAALACGVLGLLGGLFAGRRTLGREECLRSLVPIVSAKIAAGRVARNEASSGAVTR
jgi:positive regulator of sigma E activity